MPRLSGLSLFIKDLPAGIVIPTVEISTERTDQVRRPTMLWQPSIEAQRPTPRGEVAVSCAGRPGYLTGNEKNHDLGRWRS